MTRRFQSSESAFSVNIERCLRQGGLHRRVYPGSNAIRPHRTTAGNLRMLRPEAQQAQAAGRVEFHHVVPVPGTAGKHALLQSATCLCRLPASRRRMKGYHPGATLEPCPYRVGGHAYAPTMKQISVP